MTQLIDRFQYTLKQIENDSTIDRSRAIIITPEESNRIYNEINTEMREVYRELMRKVSKPDGTLYNLN